MSLYIFIFIITFCACMLKIPFFLSVKCYFKNMCAHFCLEINFIHARVVYTEETLMMLKHFLYHSFYIVDKRVPFSVVMKGENLLKSVFLYYLSLHVLEKRTFAYHSVPLYVYNQLNRSMKTCVNAVCFSFLHHTYTLFFYI